MSKHKEKLKVLINKIHSKHVYYTTQAVSGPITEKSTNQNALLPVQYSLSIGPALFVKNLQSFSSLARDRTGRKLARGLFCTDLPVFGPYCQDLGPIFSQYGPHAWLIRCKIF